MENLETNTNVNDSQGQQESTSQRAESFYLFTELPAELQGRIYRLACSPSKAATRVHPDWILISRQSREWVEPLFYESIILPSSVIQLHEFKKTLELKPKEYFAVHVKRIHIPQQEEYDKNVTRTYPNVEVDLLSICDNIDTLECWNTSKMLTPLLSTKEFPKLKTLFIHLDVFGPDSKGFNDSFTFKLPIFQNVTHLEIAINEIPEKEAWSSLRSLKKLIRMRVGLLGDHHYQDIQTTIFAIYTLAHRTYKYFPFKLEYFVILIPIESLYAITDWKCQKTWGKGSDDKVRWRYFKALMTGTFDSRIIIGYTSDNHLEVGNNNQVLEKYMQFIPGATNTQYPREEYIAERGVDEWEDAVKKGEDREQLKLKEMSMGFQ